MPKIPQVVKNAVEKNATVAMNKCTPKKSKKKVLDSSDEESESDEEVVIAETKMNREVEVEKKETVVLETVEVPQSPNQEEVEKLDADIDSKKKKASRPKKVFPLEAEVELLKVLAEGLLAASAKQALIDTLRAVDNAKWANLSTKSILEKIQSLAVREKRKGDDKFRWWLKNEAMEQLSDTSLKQMVHALDLENQSKHETKAASNDQVNPVAAVSSGLTNQPLCSKAVARHDDPRIKTHEEWVQKLHSEVDVLLSSFSKEILLANIAEASSIENLDDDATSVFIAAHIQGSLGTLEEEAQRIHELFPPNFELAAVTQKIVLLSERKAYGVKEKSAIANTDENKNALWRWEVVNPALLEKDALKQVNDSRRKLQHLGRRIASGSKILKLLSQNVDGKLEAKIAREEETIQKLMREDELQRQKTEEKARKDAEKKAKEEEQAKQKQQAKEAAAATKSADTPTKQKKPSKPSAKTSAKPLTHFFQKAKKTEDIPSESEKVQITSSANQTEDGLDESPLLTLGSVKPSSQGSIDNAIGSGSPLDVLQWAAGIRKKRAARRHCSASLIAASNAEAKKTEDEPFLSSDQHDAILANLCKKKLFQFHGTFRPPYFGTFRKTSSTVGARRPFSKDPKIDYDVDSDEEWEEAPEDGESIAESIGGEDEGGEELDYQDGWLLEDDVVEYESGVEDESEDDEDDRLADKNNGERRKKTKKRRRMAADSGFSDMYHVGILFDVQRIKDGSEGELAKNLLKFSVDALPNNKDFTECIFPLVPPSQDEIKFEVWPRKRKKAQEGLGTPNKKQKSKTASSPGTESAETGNNTTASSGDEKSTEVPFPNDQLQELAKALQGNQASIKQIVDDFYQSQRNRFAIEFSKQQIEGNSQSCVLRSPTPKKHIKAKILEMARREKREGDNKPRWYLASTGSA